MKTDKAALERLHALAGTAPRRRANVRTLAQFAANSECKLATLGFAARVDFDRLLAKTRFEVPYGQSPFAFRRGNTFEERLRREGHAPILGLFRDKLAYDVTNAQVANMRGNVPLNEGGMLSRARATEALIAKIIRGETDAPNLIDGAVLTRKVGGVPAYFEADAVAAHFQRPIHAGEIKSFPTVDGQADPDKIGSAVAQVSIYILLLRELVAKLGGPADLVSTNALIITPLNTGLQPTMTVKAVGREVDRAGRILDAAPTVIDLTSNLPDGLPTFERVANVEADPEQRIESAYALAEQVGTRYMPSCLSSCGMSRLCRERAHTNGTTDRFGGKLVRLLPQIDSLDRVAELAAGAAPSAEESPVAEQLVRAATLRARLVGAPPRKRGRAS